LLGIILGCILAKFAKVGACVLAAWGGFTGGLILVETIIAWTQQEWLFWVVTIGCAVAAAILCWFAFDITVITASVVLGAYSLMRGVSFYGGHYYNEFTMAKMISDGLMEDIDPYYWCYIALFVVLVLVGGYVQWRALKKERKEEE